VGKSHIDAELARCVGAPNPVRPTRYRQHGYTHASCAWLYTLALEFAPPIDDLADFSRWVDQTVDHLSKLDRDLFYAPRTIQ
jgi:hypothetical protein